MLKQGVFFLLLIMDSLNIYWNEISCPDIGLHRDREPSVIETHHVVRGRVLRILSLAHVRGTLAQRPCRFRAVQRKLMIAAGPMLGFNRYLYDICY